jgi:hypothetical protein
VPERPECLAHVPKLAKRRIRLVGLRAAGRLLGRTPAAAPKVENDKQSSDGNEDDDSGYHTWTDRGRRETVARGYAARQIRLLRLPALNGLISRPPNFMRSICQTSPPS